VVYARVSTDTQDLDLQTEESREFAARKGWTLVATYSDVASEALGGKAVHGPGSSTAPAYT